MAEYYYFQRNFADAAWRRIHKQPLGEPVTDVETAQALASRDLIGRRLKGASDKAVWGDVEPVFVSTSTGWRAYENGETEVQDG